MYSNLFLAIPLISPEVFIVGKVMVAEDLQKTKHKMGTNRFFKSISPLFLVLVVLPTLCGVIYYGVLANDVYISESHFVVRSTDKQTMTTLGAVLKGAGLTSSLDDTHAVNDFIRSRDALSKVEKSMQFSQRYQDQQISYFDRFNGFLSDGSFESLYKYYNNRVNVTYETTSSISVLKVKAYTAQDAKQINQFILNISEDLINSMNKRAQADLIGFAEKEVVAAKERSSEAALALASFRQKNKVFNPEGQSTLALQQINKLNEQILVAKTKLRQVQAIAPENPQIATLQLQIDDLEGELSKQTSQLTAGSTSFAAQSSNFQRLTLNKEFADKQLAYAMTALETARSDAQKKQLYLQRVVQPNTPDIALEPKRLKHIFSIFLFSLILWGVAKLLIASIKEHHD